MGSSAFARFALLFALAGACAADPSASSAPRRGALSAELSPDGELTLSSPADYTKRREALARFIWGPSGFPGEKMPSAVVKDVPSLVGPAPNLRRVDKLVFDLEGG